MSDFIQAIKKQLEEQRAETKKRLEEVAHKSSKEGSGYATKFPEYGRAEDENADEVATFVDSLSVEDNLEKTLGDIESALKKISQGRYGICEKCGKPIPNERLQAFPTAKSCLECKGKI